MDSPRKSSQGRSRSDLRAALGHDVEALIRFAHFAPAEEALEIARELLMSGAWTGSASSFRGLLDNKLRPLAEWVPFALDLLRLIREESRRSGEIRPEAYAVLEMFGRQGPDEVRSSLVAWFVEAAGPSEAKLAVDLVRNSSYRTDGDPYPASRSWCLPVIRWLVDNGASELIRGDDPLVMLYIVEACLTAFPERLIAALKIVEQSDKPDDLFTVDGDGSRILYPAIEAGLAQGLPTEWVDQILGGAYSALNWLGVRIFFAPLRPELGLPHLRQALLGALAHGRWHSGLGLEVWKFALCLPAPSALAFDDAGLEAVLRALIDVRGEQVPDEAELQTWIALIGGAWFERFGLRRPDPVLLPGAWPLDILAGEARLALGIARALATALAKAPASDDRLDPARTIIREAERDPRLASVALLRLPQSARPTPTPVVTLAEVEDLLKTVVCADWTAPIAGVDCRRLFRGARSVLITSGPERPQLDAGILVAFQDEEILTGDVGTYERIINKLPERGEALAACALYFVHEVMHVLQGIQHKSRVTALRATGREYTLAHLDLEADDLAARIVAAATAWPLLFLKDLEARCIAAFPASMHHTNASVTRKSVRQISLRVDYLLRERAMFGISPDASGYASLDLPYGKGEMLLIWNGPTYHELLAVILQEAGEVDELSRTARDGGTLEELDAKIIGLLARIQAYTSHRQNLLGPR